MPTEGIQIDHHFVVRPGARSFQLNNGRTDITSAIDGGVFTYRRAFFGHDASIVRDHQAVLEIRRGLVLRRATTELLLPDGRMVASAREGTALHVTPVEGMEFTIEPADLSLSRSRDSRFLYREAEVSEEVCGQIDKTNWLKSGLEVKLSGRVSKELALFSSWWMWRRWEISRTLG